MLVLRIVVLVTLLLSSGLAVWLTFAQSLKKQLNAIEALFLIVITGTAVTGWMALLLAGLGQFSLPLLAGLVLGGSLLMGGWAVWHGRHRHAFRGLTFRPVSLLALIPLGIALTLSPQPFEYVVGGRDHGIYVNTGVYIAKTGGVIVHDPELAAVPASSRSVLVRPEVRVDQAGYPGPWSEGQRLLGLTIRDIDAGIYNIHAFHLYPAFIAVFYAVGGLDFALATTVVLGLLGGFSIYLVATRLFGQAIGLLTYFLLIINVTQMWFTQYPSAEIVVQFFFWSGLFTFILTLEHESRVTAVLAGVCFGLLHLAKLDAVFIPVILGIFFFYAWLRGQFRPVYWWCIAPYFILSIHALLHAFFISTVYFVDHVVRTLMPQFIANRLIEAAADYPYPQDIWSRFFSANWAFMALFLLIAVVILWAIRRWRALLDNGLAWIENKQHAQSGLAVTLGVIIIVMIVVSPYVDMPLFNRFSRSAHLFRLYMTRVGLLTGAAGLLYLIYHSHTRPLRLATLMLVGGVLPFFVFGPRTAPDHFWVIRRFVPIAFPALILATAHLIWELRPRQRKWWPVGAIPLGIFIGITLGFWQHTAPVARVVEYEGLAEQLEHLAHQFPPDAVLLLVTDNKANRLDLPLWFIFDKTVFAIRAEVVADTRLATAVTYWQDNGRDVYWLAADGSAPPTWPGWTAVLEHTQTVATPLVERPRNHIPRQIGVYMVHLDVYRLQPELTSAR